MYKTRTSKLWLATLAVLLSSLACNAATSMIQPDDKLTSRPSSAETVQEASCPAVLSSIVDTATTAESVVPPADEYRLVTYSIQGNDLGHPRYEAVPSDLYDEQVDAAAQQAIWSYFTMLIPGENREFLTEFSIITDGRNNLLAAVAQSAQDPTHWRLEIDLADAQDYENLTFTLIHEFGHLLTLNEEQVSPSMATFNHPHDPAVIAHEAAMCPNFFASEGCSHPGSYINQFYGRFWTDKYDEWYQVETIRDDYLYFRRLNEFYEKYQDQFVTEYAATDPGEDVAESWAYFVLSPKPQGSTIAEHKVLFFYEYPELVRLRQEILNNVCLAFPQ